MKLVDRRGTIRVFTGTKECGIRGVVGLWAVGLLMAGSASASTLVEVGYRWVESDGQGERVLSEGRASTVVGKALPMGFSRQAQYPVEGEPVGAPCSRADAGQLKEYAILVDQTTEAGAVVNARWSWCDRNQVLREQEAKSLAVTAGGASTAEWEVEGKRYQLTITYQTH